MTRVLTYLCLLFLAANLNADTVVPAGAISGLWTIEQSPYVIADGTVTVNNGDTLRIMPGVVVRFDGPFQFRVSGVLRAIGSADSLITFTADTVANPAGWGGIRFASARDSNRLSFCVIENGRASGSYPDQDGGGVAQVGTHRITLDNVVFQYNQSTQSGGAYLGAGSGGALFSQCQFLGNAGGGSGGAMYLTSGSPNTFQNCTFTGNIAGFGSGTGHNGGAVDSWHANATFIACSFLQNHCQSVGGAVQGHGVMSFISCNFDSNRADNSGGGIYLDDSTSTFSLTNCLIRWNSSTYFGGGLYSFDSSPMVTNCQIIGNHTGSRGGGVNCYRWSNASQFNNCLITQNSCSGQGGAVWIATYSHPSFRNCEISWNTANTAGGLYSTNHGTAVFVNCTLHHNSATGNGGALYLDQYSLSTLDSSTLSFNTAGGAGGGMLATGSFFSISACSLAGNSAKNGGAAAIIQSCATSSPVSIVNSVVESNHADSSGGAFYLQGLSCTTLERSLLLDNSAGYAGGAVACVGGAIPTLSRSDVLRNHALFGAGIYINASSPLVTTDIIAANNGNGIDLTDSPDSKIQFCDFFANSTENIAGDNLPPGLGSVSNTNVNGNPCDAFSNLFLSPLLPDTAAGNFHLGANSPCVDAGDSALTCDPDLTIPDIGAVAASQNAALFTPRDVVISDSGLSVFLNWRPPLHICKQAPLTYEVWSSTYPDSTLHLLATTPDTALTDSTNLLSKPHQLYQVIWRTNP